ncbi:MAG: NUDIX domain-containing protein [Candidatus Daviesbacteria bacterium]|nr:NUDIX domain-containing protein [Candidatus Daviesbacteria bacterium]
MHPIQKHILHELIFHSFLPYSRLKPQGIESNLFIYHLKQLISEGLIQKRADGKYELSPEGQSFIEHLSLKNLKPIIQPKIVTLIVCQNKNGEFLLYKRNHQPFLGLVGFPYGKIHLGETIAEAAERELKEKTDLSAELQHRGDVYLTTFRDKNLLTQTFCHIFTANNVKGELLAKSEIGECFWSKIDFSEEKLIPGFKDVLNLVKKSKNNLFFAEFIYHLK